MGPTRQASGRSAARSAPAYPLTAAQTPISTTSPVTSARGTTANVNQTAAVEFALGLVSRAFMTAVTEPRIPTLSSLMLSMIARQTVSLGNAVFQIIVERGEFDAPAGRPVQRHRRTCGPESWNYVFRQQRPNGDNPHELDTLPQQASPYAGMVHVRNTPHPAAPWRGVSPLIAAGCTADQLAKYRGQPGPVMPSRLAGYLLLPLPDGATPMPRSNQGAKAALSTGRGKLTLSSRRRSEDGGKARQAKPQA